MSPGISLNWRRISSIILKAFLETPRMIMAENMIGIDIPMNMPIITRGFIKLKTMGSPVMLITISWNEARRASAVSPAAPIAKPFVMAFVVFPAASISSVMSTMSSPSLAISAMPLALSPMGP